jgi:steroid delta-isomerase-like uncharacterized protein
MNAGMAEKLAHRWHMDLFQDGRIEVAEEILAPGFVAHVNGQEMQGADGARQLAAILRSAFPDLQITHQESLVAGDRVAIRWMVEGTHQGEYAGVPPTGEQVRVEGIDFFHLADGKIAEVWIAFDNAAILQAVGAVPEI